MSAHSLTQASDRTLMENFIVASALAPAAPSTIAMCDELERRHMSTDPDELRARLYGVGHTWRKGTLKRHALQRIRSTYVDAREGS